MTVTVGTAKPFSDQWEGVVGCESRKSETNGFSISSHGTYIVYIYNAFIYAGIFSVFIRRLFLLFSIVFRGPSATRSHRSNSGSIIICYAKR